MQLQGFWRSDRCGTAAILLATALTFTFPFGQEARAQSFLEALFGKAYAPSPLRSRSAYIPLDPSAYPDMRSAERAGTYRTVCVRHCDGYYWPISSAVPRSRFYRDADVCRQSCGAEASLFYHAPKDDAADMVDLTGRSYTELPMAFRYRKSLVDGCKCKPEPWSESESERHRAYARGADAGDDNSAVTVIAGGSASTQTLTPIAVVPLPGVPPPSDSHLVPAAEANNPAPSPVAAPAPAPVAAPKPRTRQRYVGGNSSTGPAVPFVTAPSSSAMRWPGD